MAGKQTWKVRFNLKDQTVAFITRADNTVRQVFNASKIHENHQALVALRGLKVLLEERTSDVPGSDVNAKMDARQEVYELLQTPAWAKERVGGGFSVAIHFDAIALLTGKTVQQVRDEWKDTPEDKRAAILASEKVKRKIAELEDASDDAVELDDLLDD